MFKIFGDNFLKISELRVCIQKPPYKKGNAIQDTINVQAF